MHVRVHALTRVYNNLLLTHPFPIKQGKSHITLSGMVHPPVMGPMMWLSHPLLGLQVCPDFTFLTKAWIMAVLPKFLTSGNCILFNPCFRNLWHSLLIYFRSAFMGLIYAWGPLFLSYAQAHENTLCLSPGAPFPFQHFTKESLIESLCISASQQSTDAVSLSCFLMDAHSLCPKGLP